MGALSVWYQMTHKPIFWLAFKAISQIRTALTNELKPRFYAYHAYFFMFNDEDFVYDNVLHGIKKANLIYSDPLYGLNNISGLYWWV